MAVRVLVCVVVAAPAFAAPPVRLADVLARIEERGPDQAVAVALVGIARAEVRTARMLPNPGLLVGGGAQDPIASAALQLKLPIFGQRGARVRAAERGAEQAAAEAIFTRWQLRHAARVAYYSMARAEEEVAIAMEVEALTKRVADMAREKYEVGTGTRLDERQASLAHVRALQDISDRQAVARVARLELARLLGEPAEAVGAPADALAQVGPTPPMPQLLDGVRTHHPELHALFVEREAGLARARAARADRRPLPSLELGIEIADPNSCGNPLGHFGGLRCISPRAALGFDLPVLNLNGGPIERAEAEAHLAEKKARAAFVRVEVGVRSAYQNLDAAAARARFFDIEYVPSALAVEQMAREGFAVGRTGLLPLIEAARAVLDARLGRAEALFAVQAARADLEEASGVTLSTP